MERQISKRKRIFSYQPNTNPSTIFARNYLNHLIPALKSIKQTTKPTSEITVKNVRHEVDMALAQSVNQEFTWTRSLKQRLRSKESSSRSTESTEKREEEEKEEEEENEEEVIVNGRMRELRGLVPGGEEMDVEEMLSELGSYIACLELQTAVLKSLVE